MRFLRLQQDAITDDSGGVWARLWRGNPLEATPPAADDAEPCVAWTGWTGVGEPEREVFEPGFVWQEAVWDRLGDRLSGAGLMIRPHARHVVGDVNALRAWQTKHGTGPDQAGVVLEPAALFTPAMVKQADSHLDRIALGARNIGNVRAVVVSNASLTACDWGEELEPTGLGGGALPAELVAACCVVTASAHGVPVVLRDGSYEADASAVSAAAGRYSGAHAGGRPVEPGSTHA